MRVAITTDWLKSFGGAERVLIELHRLFPDAPIYTSVHDPRKLPPAMRDWDVRTTFLQRLPFARRRHDAFLPLMPMAFEQLDMREYDLVITTSSACAKGVITRPDAINLCYCHTPCRYIWDMYHEYTGAHPLRAMIAPVAHWLRLWDRASADRVDHFVANSAHTAARIRSYYRRDAEIVHPPVDTSRIRPDGDEPDDYYLVVSRLVAYKRVDLAVEACTRTGRRLVVVGDGPELKRLRSMAGPTVEFLGARGDDDLATLYARARALLFPGLEDFGITPVEAQAAGRPVVAFDRGGARETVIDGETGVLFAEQTVDALVTAIEALEAMPVDPHACRSNAERFDAAEFRERVMAAIRSHTTSATRSGGSAASASARGARGRAPLPRASA